MQDFENGVDTGWRSQRAHSGRCVTPPVPAGAARGAGSPSAGEEAKGLLRPGPAWARAPMCDGLGTRSLALMPEV